MYILLALQLITNPGHYIWTQIASFQTPAACYLAIDQMITAKGKLEKRENYICVSSGEIENGPYQLRK